MNKFLLIALGGSIGAVSRYVVSNWAAERFGASFPYGTAIVNIVGCYIIGLFMVIATERYMIHPYWRFLITTGFLGGLTTFSSFGYETLKLIEDGNVNYALYNILINVVIGLLGTWLGFITARAI